MSLSKLVILSGLLAFGSLYQNDKILKDDQKLSTILPPPKSMTHGNAAVLIDPCNFSLRQDKNIING